MREDAVEYPYRRDCGGDQGVDGAELASGTAERPQQARGIGLVERAQGERWAQYLPIRPFLGRTREDAETGDGFGEHQQHDVERVAAPDRDQDACA